MRKIDTFQHILPIKYKEELLKRGRDSWYLRQVEGHPGLFNLDIRFRVMDKHEGLQQVLTLPPFWCSLKPEDEVEMAKLGNDELAKLVEKYPDRFVGCVAALPPTNIDAGLKEIDRAINDLHMNGIELTTSINGKPLDSPEFMPIFEKMQAYDLPIWIHPHREDNVPDYPAVETFSKYGLFATFGWPYESTLAMARLVFSGVMEKFPKIKTIIHHCGAMIPYFNQRMATVGLIIRSSDPNKNVEVEVPAVDYFRRFYGDTILGGDMAALMCGYSFFGAEHMVFGTDYPFGGKFTETRMATEVGTMDRMPIPPYEKEKILYKNTVGLLKIKK